MDNTLENFWLDSPTPNGRIYDKECLKQIKKSIEKKTAFVYQSPSPDLSTVIGIAQKISKYQGRLRIKWKYLQTPMGKIMMELNKQKAKPLKITVSGIGSIDKDNAVKDYTFRGFIAYND